MNAQRRKDIEAIRARLEQMQTMRDDIRDEVDSLRADENDARENLPDSLKEGEKGEKMQSAVDALQEVYDALDGLDFDELFSQLDTAGE
jgi:predicted nuclease with TOPRIM domain